MKDKDCQQPPKDTVDRLSASTASVGCTARPAFFVGLHMPNHAPVFARCMVSVNRLKNRKSDFYPQEWIMDSGAFTEISTYGRYRSTVQEYANRINRWKTCGTMLAAVSQDYMCEPFILKRPG